MILRILILLSLAPLLSAQTINTGDILYSIKNSGTGSTLWPITPSTGTELIALDGAGKLTKLARSTFATAAHNQSWSTITSTPTTLSGYGISDAQPLDADLTTLAAATPAGLALMDDADASAQRTTLGLGTLATQSGTISDYLTTATAASTYARSASPAFTGSGTIEGSFRVGSVFFPTRTITIGTNIIFADIGGSGYSTTYTPATPSSGPNIVTMPSTGIIISTTSTASVTNTMLAGSIDLTTKVTGALPVANGGTGSTTLTANNVILGNGTSAVQFVAPGSTAGYVLASDGTTWVTANDNRSYTQVVGTHTEHGNDGNQSNGSDTTATSRTKVYLAADCTDVQILLTNIYGLAAPAANPYNITVKAAIELSDGTVYPVYFRGARTAVLGPGAAILTDPFANVFTKGEYVWLRVNVSVSSGDKWPRWVFFSNSIDTFQAGVDYTDSGTLSGTNGYAYRASGLYGRTLTTPASSVVIIGDSISTGSGGNTHYYGYIQRSFGSNYGASTPHVLIGAAGETAANFVLQSKTIYRLGQARGCTAAIVELGTNDCFSGTAAATIKANLISIYTRLRLLGITRIYQTTITPRTTSSDSFATVGNQTTTNSSHEAVRVELNAWIRANTAAITGYFEIADIVESARDSGKWKASYTTDGIHPTDAAHTLMAVGVTPASLLAFP